MKKLVSLVLAAIIVCASWVGVAPEAEADYDYFISVLQERNINYNVLFLPEEGKKIVEIFDLGNAGLEGFLEDGCGYEGGKWFRTNNFMCEF